MKKSFIKDISLSAQVLKELSQEDIFPKDYKESLLRAARQIKYPSFNQN